MKLSNAQKELLLWALDHYGKLNGGRYGWSTSSLRALCNRGLLKMDKQSTWDSEWSLTPDGWDVAREQRTASDSVDDNTGEDRR